MGLDLKPKDLLPANIEDAENAALVHNRVFALFDKLEENHPVYEILAIDFEGNEELPSLTVLENPEIQGILAEIRQAENYELCNWNRNYQEKLLNEMPGIIGHVRQSTF